MSNLKDDEGNFVPAQKLSLVAKFASKFGVEPEKMMSTLKATAFKVDKDKPPITNEQMMALLIVADQYGLNPWTREIYAFPDKGGIVPVVGVDGWARIINQHPQFDGISFTQDDASCTCTIYRKDRVHPIVITEYLSECIRPSFQPWKSHPKRMLRHKAMIQCSRIAFGFAGIYDQDEAERIIEGEAERMPEAKPTIQRPRSKSAAEVAPENSVSISESMHAMLIAKLEQFDLTETEIADHFGLSQLAELPANKAQEVSDFIESLGPQHEPP